MTRAEHMAWCKRRALGLVDIDPDLAIVSMISDLGKHEETASSQLIASLIAPINRPPSEVLTWIDGFN